jgi:hypothetical protein
VGDEDMLVLTNEGYEIYDNHSEICSLPENTKFAEVLSWLNMSLEVWNSWYKNYREKYDYELRWVTIEEFSNVHCNDLEEILAQNSELFDIVTPQNVEAVFENIIETFRYELKYMELLELCRDRICLAMVVDLEDAIARYFPELPISVMGAHIFRN